MEGFIHIFVRFSYLKEGIYTNKKKKLNCQENKSGMACQNDMVKLA